ncbi:hypothetical protein J6590_010681 [Homalodisca vitripennis]|nr:hypothetical protein J6590_010681 [Homalodisca vitripennis]
MDGAVKGQVTTDFHSTVRSNILYDNTWCCGILGNRRSSSILKTNVTEEVALSSSQTYVMTMYGVVVLQSNVRYDNVWCCGVTGNRRSSSILKSTYVMTIYGVVVLQLYPQVDVRYDNIWCCGVTGNRRSSVNSQVERNRRSSSILKSTYVMTIYVVVVLQSNVRYDNVWCCDVTGNRRSSSILKLNVPYDNVWCCGVAGHRRSSIYSQVERIFCYETRESLRQGQGRDDYLLPKRRKYLK